MFLVAKNRIPVALLGAWTCMVAVLFALHLTANAIGIGAIWLMGFGSSLVVLAMRETQARERDAIELCFRELFEGAPIAYHELDRSGIIQRVNRAECALLGYEERELVGRPILDFIAASDKDAAQRAITGRLAGEQPVQPLRRHFSRRDGSKLTLELYSSPVSDGRGEVVGLRAALVDITERVLAQEALRASEEMFRTVSGGMLNALIILDGDGRVVLWNPAAERMFGYTKAEMMGQTVQRLVPLELLPRLLANVRELNEADLGKEYGKTTEWQCLRRDGSEFPMELALSSVQVCDRRWAVGVVHDLTDRKHAEEALRESEERFRSILRTAMDGFWRVDMQGRLLEVNETYCRMSGYSAEELLAMRLSGLVYGQTADGMAAHMKTIMTRGEDRFEARHRRKDGTVFDVEVSVQYGSAEGGRCVAFLRDITERKRTAEALLLRTGELAHSNTELEQQLVRRGKAEEELRAREYSLSESQRIAHVGSWSCELPIGSNVIAWTPETYRVFGVSPDTFVPSIDAFQNLIHPDDRAAMQAWIGACVAAEEPPDVEFRVGLRDGNVRYILGRGHLVLDAENKPARIVGIAQEITERKRAEQEVRRANEKLSASVRKLEMRGVREGILGEMRTFLQACSSTQEIAPIIAHSMLRLFPNSDGALFLLSPSKTDLETGARWGGFPEEQAENVFSPDTCWGLRRGSLHVVDDIKSGLICPHLKHLDTTAYACMPLTAKSDVLGLLHLRSRPGAQPAEAHETIAALEDISPMLSELLALSISNLRLSETLRMQSIRDPLTGLFNRRYMEECLEREIWRASRNGRPIGVVMADIDYFKKFNDMYGHGAGDYLLSAFGNLVNNQIRGSDIACRYGGEEFTIIMPDAGYQDAPWRANDLLEKVRSLKLVYSSRELGPVTISMGVSTYPEGGATSEELLRTADAALYKAKIAGRNQVVVHGEGVLSPLRPRPEQFDPSAARVLEGAA